MIVYQTPELEIVKGLNVSLLCLFLIIVELPPEAIYTTHIQDFVCVDLPCIAAEKHGNNYHSAFYKGCNDEK